MTSPTQRKRGAPKGNLNALKHGFYAKHFTPEEQARLGKTPEDMQEEINILCVFRDRLTGDLTKANGFHKAEVAKLNTLTTICLAIGTLKRGQAFLHGKVSSVDQAIEEALMTKRTEWILA